MSVAVFIFVMLFNTASSTLYFVTNFGLCLSRP
nr:MAG TPA: hypothetical protein [Caudoviricetes sp.]